MLNMYIVYKNYPQTGKIERHSAYFSEDEAREAARLLVGKDGALIGMETIPVRGDPNYKKYVAYMQQHPEEF